MLRIVLAPFVIVIAGLCAACSSTNDLQSASTGTPGAPAVLIAESTIRSTETESTNRSGLLVPNCAGVFDLCGYVDSSTKTVVIDRKFQRSFPFREGLAAVKINGRYGYIDQSGNLVIDPAFELAGTFNQGLAEVVVGDKAGVIDRSGAFRLTPQFQRAIPLSSTTIIAAPGIWTSGRGEDAEALEGPHDRGFTLGLKPLAGLYHIEDGWLTTPTLTFRAFERGSSDMIWAAEADTMDKRRNMIFGLMKVDGSWQVDPAFSHVQTLNEGLAVVGAKGSDEKERRGAVDSLGEIRVPLQYENLNYWYNGYGIAHQNDQVGLVRKDGRLVAGQFWDEVERPERDGLARVREGDIWMSVTAEGDLVPDALDGTAILECKNGLTIRRAGTGVRVFGSDGTPASGLVYDRLHVSDDDCARPLSVRRQQKWGYITHDGLAIPPEPGFDTAYRFDGGSAWAQKDGLWGKIDLSGAAIVQFQYDMLRSMRRGYFKVSRNGEELFVNASGVEVKEVPEDPAVRSSWLQCTGGGRLFSSKNKWGLAGPGGEVLIPADHIALTCFKNGMSWIPVSTEHAWCPIGPDGIRIRAAACKTTRYPYEQTHHFPETLDPDAYVSSVMWFVAHLEWADGRRQEAPRMIGDGIQSAVSSSIRR